jgi:hypothetical protein
LCLCVIICASLQAQVDSSAKIIQTLNSLSTKELNAVNNRYSLLDKLIEHQTEKMLQRMQKREASLQKQMQGKDSLKAKQLFAQTQIEYQQLLIKLQSPPGKNITNPLRDYIPVVDSMQTAMRFLSQANNYKIPGIPLDKLAQVQAVSQQLLQLQTRLQNAGEIQQYIAQREQFLKNSLSGFGLGRKLTGINKESYYYQQQLAQYKSLLHDPKKIEEKALFVITQQPAFESFMQKHSYLSQLMGLPADYGSEASIAGLQTKAQIHKLIGQKMNSMPGTGTSTNSFGGGQFLNQQMQVAQQQLSHLQNKAMFLGNGGGSSTNMVMPDFKPNSQKTKSFLNRLEYGFNIQTQKTNTLLPTTSSLGLILGYKINDKSTLGVGASYNLGVGNGINHIQFSSQGVGLRSYLDIKAKGSFWISGGLEYNYFQAFQKIQQLYNMDAWQKSALLGITKKYKITKNKTCNIQLLYDFLYRDHLPVSPPLLFRMGYSF